MIISAKKDFQTGFKARFDAVEQQRIMSYAQKASEKSRCTRAMTGVVIADSKGKILGKGCNTISDEFKELCGKDANNCCPRIEFNILSGKDYAKSCLSICAEVVAISDAGLKKIEKLKDEAGATLFLFGHSFLCKSCSKMVIMAKKIKDIYIQPSKDAPIKHMSREELLENIKKMHEKDISELKTL